MVWLEKPFEFLTLVTQVWVLRVVSGASVGMKGLEKLRDFFGKGAYPAVGTFI